MTYGEAKQQDMFSIKHSGLFNGHPNAKHLKKSYNERTDNNRLSMIDVPLRDQQWLLFYLDNHKEL